MKVQLRPETTWVATTDKGVVIGKFVEESRWEGMAKLKSANGVMIVDMNPVSEALSGIFDRPICATVVQASPYFVAKFQNG